MAIGRLPFFEYILDERALEQFQRLAASKISLE
jgi:hypothetical protein